MIIYGNSKYFHLTTDNLIVLRDKSQSTFEIERQVRDQEDVQLGQFFLTLIERHGCLSLRLIARVLELDFPLLYEKLNNRTWARPELTAYPNLDCTTISRAIGNLHKAGIIAPVYSGYLDKVKHTK